MGLYGGTQDMNFGFIFNMDTHSMRRFLVTGDTSTALFNDGPTQETVPSWYDGTTIRRWNYNAANK